MPGANECLKNAFDFSLDAVDFRKILWLQLRAKATFSSDHMLEDDNLEWGNAAGIPDDSPTDDAFPTP